MRPVTAQFLKHPDILHWGFEASYLGEDEFGVWCAVPAGSRRWKGEAPHHPTGSDAVFCAPREGWWHLHYSGAGGDTYSHFVDIATTPLWVTSSRYEMVDLDLDVAIRHDGSIVIEDEDEFEVHQVIYGYTPEMVSRALDETRWVVGALESRSEPFFEVAADWLAKVGRPHPGHQVPEVGLAQGPGELVVEP
jgi:hypothetical protein